MGAGAAEGAATGATDSWGGSTLGSEEADSPTGSLATSANKAEISSPFWPKIAKTASTGAV